MTRFDKINFASKTISAISFAVFDLALCVLLLRAFMGYGPEISHEAMLFTLLVLSWRDRA